MKKIIKTCMVYSFDHSLRDIQFTCIYGGLVGIRWTLFCILRWCPYFGNFIKMVLDPFCDEVLLLLNEIINFTVFTVQDFLFFSLQVVCYVLYLDFFVLSKICFEKKKHM